LTDNEALCYFVNCQESSWSCSCLLTLHSCECTSCYTSVQNLNILSNRQSNIIIGRINWRNNKKHSIISSLPHAFSIKVCEKKFHFMQSWTKHDRSQSLSQQIENQLKTPFCTASRLWTFNAHSRSLCVECQKDEIGGDKSYFSLTHGLKSIHNLYQLMACN
jgi:hypothetical protein